MSLELNQIYNGECIEVMKLIPDKSINLILCDLPYGTTQNKWDTIIPLEPLWEQYKRIITDNGAIVLTASQPFTTSLISSNPKMFKYELIWVKDNSTGFLNAKKQPLRKHENILIFYNKPPLYKPQFSEGKPYKTVRGRNAESSNYNKFSKDIIITENNGYRYPTSILKFNRESGLHPTQKPVPLFEYIIRTYTNDGDTVLDNCAGAGTTAIACINTKRNYILIEKEEKYYKISKDRIEKHLMLSGGTIAA